ncbi:MAG: cation-translocating P-type ATPase [Clostridia bacterium]|nr:cation-translocating P-type ATPase [Clostridia bacterium]
MKEWFQKTVDETVQELETDLNQGLTVEQVKQRQEKFGLNEIQETKKTSILQRFIAQFKDFMIIVLIVAAIISGIVGVMRDEGFTDTIIIMIVVFVNAIIGVAQEIKAEKSLEALKKLSSYTAKVIRNGSMVVVPSSELVPGDIVVLETGDYIPADLRIIEAVNLKSQESSLTGESVPVEKDSVEIEDIETGIGDRKNMLFSSSLITYGRGKGIAVETGMNTEVGKIAQMLDKAEKQITPLQMKLNKLGKTLGIVSLAICAFIFLIGIIQGKDLLSMFMVAVSLAVAVVPEGLVAVTTIVLAIGVQKMVKKNAIVKKLPAVETLGSSTVICSDKTGTLTQNKMTVKRVFWNRKLLKLEDIKVEDEEMRKLVFASMLCNDTKITPDNGLVGDPTETALVDMGFNLDFDPSVYDNMPRMQEIPFDSERKLMTTVNKVDGKYIVFTKGGVDELLDICNSYIENGEIKTDLDNYKEVVYNRNRDMAKDALRVLAMGYKEIDHIPTDSEMKTIENGLIFIGMVGMIDPPREEVKDAIKRCKEAGIKTVMITGDHKITAAAIAKSLGILENEDEAITGEMLEKMSDEDLEKNVKNYSVYARVSPEHKVRIVKAWQKNDAVVAMTGDGVNDSPALKTSDIGCAMGIVGTDVSKEAADVILTDDNFTTIVSAVEEGRRIYDNIIKVILYLLSTNVGEIVALFVATVGAPIIAKLFGIADVTMVEILLPIQILWINLVTDSLPALALSFDPANRDIMKKKPIDPKKGVFTVGMTYRMIYQGIVIGIVTIAAFLIGITTTTEAFEGLSLDQTKIEVGQTMAFIVLSFAELVHIFNVRDNKNSIFKGGLLNNTKLLWAALASAGFMFVILFIPVLREVFSIPVLPAGNILEIILLVLTPIIVVEIFKLFKINTIKE